MAANWVRSQRSKRGRIVVQRRQMGDGGEIVALGRPIVATPVGVERGDRPGEADVVDQRQHEVGRGRPGLRGLLQHLDVGGKVDHPLGVTLVGQPTGETVEVDDAPLLRHPIGDAGMERPRWAPERFADVVGRKRADPTGHGKTQPCQHRAHRRAISELQARPRH